MKKLLSIVLSVMMLVAVMPFTVSAVDAPGTYSVKEVYTYQYSNELSVNYNYAASTDCKVVIAIFNTDGDVLLSSTEKNVSQTIYDGSLDYEYGYDYISTAGIKGECLLRLYMIGTNDLPLIEPVEKSLTITPQGNTYATNNNYTESLEEETEPEVEPELPTEPTEPVEVTEPTEGEDVWYSGACGDNATWELTSAGTFTVKGTGTMYDYESYSSTPWYSYNSKIKKVVITNGITAVGKNNFYGAYDFVDLYMADSVTEIGESAFKNCYELKNIVFSKNLKSIGDSAFYRAEALTELKLPDSVETLGAYAFYDCRELASISLPNGITEIPDYCFSDVPIKSIVIPDSVTKIGDDAFRYCYSLRTVDFGKSKVTSIGDYAFSYTGLRTFTVPNTVTELGESAFYDCEDLTSITLSRAMSTLKRRTFGNCDSLKSIALPSSITVVEDDVFDNCVRLKTITFSRNLKSFGSIYDCGVTKLNFREGLEHFGGAMHCYGLTSITIPSTATIDCYDDYGNYTYSSGIARECYSLKTAEVKSTVMTELPENSFLGSNKLETVVLSDAITSIGNYAFAGCTNLANINMPASLEKIGYAAFGSCVGLKRITFPDTLKSIDGYAFEYCSELTTVVMGENLATMEYGAFYGADALKRIYMTGDFPSGFDYNLFYDIRGFKLYYPEGNPTYTDDVMNYLSGISDRWVPYNGVDIPEDDDIAPTKYTASVDGLCPYADYFVTVVQNADSSDMVYCIQTVADDNGAISFDYASFEDCSDVSVRVYGKFTGTYGDVNGDGVVDIKDATEIQKYIAGLTSISSKGLHYANVDGDTFISIRDVTAIMCGLAGMTEKSYSFGEIEE